jgi:hypothetical protein
MRETYPIWNNVRKAETLSTHILLSDWFVWMNSANRKLACYRLGG